MQTPKLATAIVLILLSTSAALAQRSPAFGQNVLNSNVTEAEIQAAEEAWGKALIQISTDFDAGGIEKATQTANAVLDAAHGYNMGTVLFKPTLTHGDQIFRTTREGALAYFLGGNKRFPNDSGFALRGWEKYEYKNAGVIIDGDMAMTMGMCSCMTRRARSRKLTRPGASRRTLRASSESFYTTLPSPSRPTPGSKRGSGAWKRCYPRVADHTEVPMDSLVAAIPNAEHQKVGGVEIDIVRAGSVRVGRVIYPPGFRWSSDMKVLVGTESCRHAHIGFLARGHIQGTYADGCGFDFVAPSFLVLEPGHEACVVGEDPAVLIQFDAEADTVRRFGLVGEHRHS